MTVNFMEFLRSILVENLHPELQSIIKSDSKTKATQLAKKIRDLHSRGETTGIEGNMPKGSSRAYLKHEEPEHVTIDGQPHKLHVGTKVAIKATLDKFHDAKHHGNLSLGQMQNKAENNDHWVNSRYRILTKKSNGDGYRTNHDNGIFPPLMDHDEEHHHWSKVGHIGDISRVGFKQLTRTETHPTGISHDDFTSAMNRFHERNNGKYWERDKKHENHLNHVDEHPLVQKFQDYHGNTGHPTYDYQQLKNMGVFHHPDGTKHIVARDHGYDTEVFGAYQHARQNMYKDFLNK